MSACQNVSVLEEKHLERNNNLKKATVYYTIPAGCCYCVRT